jgi:hypothetical protein
VLLDEVKNFFQTHFELVDLPIVERSNVKFGFFVWGRLLRRMNLNRQLLLILVLFNLFGLLHWQVLRVLDR